MTILTWTIGVDGDVPKVDYILFRRQVRAAATRNFTSDEIAGLTDVPQGIFVSGTIVMEWTPDLTGPQAQAAFDAGRNHVAGTVPTKPGIGDSPTPREGTMHFDPNILRADGSGPGTWIYFAGGAWRRLGTDIAV